MLKYLVFKFDGQEVQLDRELSLRTLYRFPRIQVLEKDKAYYVWPMYEGHIWPLIKPNRRGAAKLSDDLVVKIFELRANEGLSPFVIGSRLHKENQVVVSTESIANVLARKTYADVAVPDELIKGINERRVVRKKRNAISEEDKVKILKLHDGGNGLSGREISRMEEFSYSDVTINKMLRKELGFIEANGVRTKHNQ